MSLVRLAPALVLLSAAAFAAIGVGYLVVPGAMLGVVGIPSSGTSDFLMRTEGVALLTGAAFLWAVRDGRPSQQRIVLAALAGYYVLGSLVDLTAFGQGVVGPASVPSGAIRIAIGVLCLLSASRLTARSD
jgi:hypothetical protein